MIFHCTKKSPNQKNHTQKKKKKNRTTTTKKGKEEKIPCNDYGTIAIEQQQQQCSVKRNKTKNIHPFTHKL